MEETTNLDTSIVQYYCRGANLRRTVSRHLREWGCLCYAYGEAAPTTKCPLRRANFRNTILRSGQWLSLLVEMVVDLGTREDDKACDMPLCQHKIYSQTIHRCH